MAGAYTKFQDIPRFTAIGNYHVHYEWRNLDKAIAMFVEDYGFDMGESDFQRGHVWTPPQQVAYVEYILRGGMSGHDIFTNCVGWDNAFAEQQGSMQLVDGKQRLTAALRFVRNEIPVFGGSYYKDFTDRLPLHARFTWHVNSLPTREAVLLWYLEMNTGGTIHTEVEIDKVRELLEAEKTNPQPFVPFVRAVQPKSSTSPVATAPPKPHRKRGK